MRTSQRTGVSTSRKPLEANPRTQVCGKSLHLSNADKIETVYGSRTPIKKQL